MKNKDRKKLQTQLAKENIQFFLKLIKSRKNPTFDAQYIREIKKISQGFNLRLTREEKSSFCQKCSLFFTAENRITRIDTKHFTKNHTCIRCNHTRRFCLK